MLLPVFNDHCTNNPTTTKTPPNLYGFKPLNIAYPALWETTRVSKDPGRTVQSLQHKRCVMLQRIPKPVLTNKVLVIVKRRSRYLRNGHQCPHALLTPRAISSKIRPVMVNQTETVCPK